MSVPSFVAGWICAWGAIVLVGVIAGLLLRLTRPVPPKFRIRLERPNGKGKHIELPQGRTA